MTRATTLYSRPPCGKAWKHAVRLESGDTAWVTLEAGHGYQIDKPRMSYDLDAKELVLRFRVEPQPKRHKRQSRVAHASNAAEN